jgi:hypothetical protein
VVSGGKRAGAAPLSGEGGNEGDRGDNASGASEVSLLVH